MIMTIFMTIIAIENLANILVNVSFLEGIRGWLAENIPFLGRLTSCKYCLSFWLALMCAHWMVFHEGPPCVKWAIYGLFMHRMAVFFSEFFERYLGGAPVNVFVTNDKK